MKLTFQFTPVLFVVPRLSHEETTVAIVQTRVADQDLRDSRLFLQALMRAVTQWVSTTRKGQRVWAQSDHDFNVGDLHHLQDVVGLKRQAVKVGIHQLHIETYVNLSSRTWHYDTVLVNESEL